MRVTVRDAHHENILAIDGHQSPTQVFFGDGRQTRQPDKLSKISKPVMKFLSFNRPLAFYILTETLSLDVIQLARAKWGKRTSAVGRELARRWLIWR